MSDPNGLAACLTSIQPFNTPSSVTDPSELFSYSNDRNISIDIKFINAPDRKQKKPPMATIIIQRNKLEFILRLKFSETNSTRMGVVQNHGDGSFALDLDGNRDSYDLKDLMGLSNIIGKMLYIGAFRNIINVGTNAEYYDMQIGQSFVTSWKMSKTGSQRQHNNATLHV